MLGCVLGPCLAAPSPVQQSVPAHTLRRLDCHLALLRACGMPSTPLPVSINPCFDPISGHVLRAQKRNQLCLHFQP